MKWNEMKWNEMKWNEMKWNEMKWNEMNIYFLINRVYKNLWIMIILQFLTVTITYR